MLPKSFKSRKSKKFWQVLYCRFLSVPGKIFNLGRALLLSLGLNNVSDTVTDIRNPKALKINQGKAVSWLRIILVIFSDSLAIALAWAIAKKIGTSVDSYFILLPERAELGFLWSIIPVTLCVLTASGIYGSNEKSRSYTNLFKAICLAQVTVLLTIFLIQPGLWISRSAFILAWGLTLFFVTSERIVLEAIVTILKSKFSFLRPKVLLLGTKEDTIKAQKLINITKTFRIQNTVDLSICCNSRKWSRILNQSKSNSCRFDEIFICSWEKIENPISLLWELKSAGIDWRILAVNLTLPKQWSEMVAIGGIPSIRFYSSAIIGVDFWCKRIFDMVISFLLLVVLALPMSLIAILIKFDSPGSVFYKQNRVGLKGRHFKVWKFRTMVENANELQQALEAENEIEGGILFKIKEDPRLTKLGKFLRRHSLDEIPQLINVLRGEMSLVGPRPLPLRDVAKLSPYHFLRHEVLPGITGLWQVSGRSNTDSEEIFKLDFVYIQNWSLVLDLQILLKTIQVVIGKTGAY